MPSREWLSSQWSVSLYNSQWRANSGAVSPPTKAAKNPWAGTPMRHVSGLISFLLVVNWISSFSTTCAADLAALPGLPPGIPILRVETPMPAPAWAVKQRRLFALSTEVTRLMDKLCFTDDGYFKGQYVHGGGDQAPDDVFEFAGKGPLLYALGADDEVLAQWWKIYRGSLRQCRDSGIFVNDMCKFLDWHHNGEHYQSFWTAALCMPDDPQYRSLLLKYAGFYDGSDPQVPNYDPQHKVVRSILHGGAGPVSRATRADWDAKEGAFWDDWLQCGHDGPINLVVTNWGTLAFMLTGDPRYKQATLAYLDAWRDRAQTTAALSLRSSTPTARCRRSGGEA